MAIKVTQTKFKTLRKGDTGFLLQDGPMVSPRAGFEINQHCPPEYKKILLDCVAAGWLNPVAIVYNAEYTMDLLRSGDLTP